MQHARVSKHSAFTTCCTSTHCTSLRVMLWVISKSFPFRVKVGCGMVVTTSTRCPVQQPNNNVSGGCSHHDTAQPRLVYLLLCLVQHLQHDQIAAGMWGRGHQHQNTHTARVSQQYTTRHTISWPSGMPRSMITSCSLFPAATLRPPHTWQVSPRVSPVPWQWLHGRWICWKKPRPTWRLSIWRARETTST